MKILIDRIGKNICSTKSCCKQMQNVLINGQIALNYDPKRRIYYVEIHNEPAVERIEFCP